MLEELHASEEPKLRKVGPPEIRNERQDWHALTADEQGDVSTYRFGLIELEELSTRAQVFLRRHYGA